MMSFGNPLTFGDLEISEFLSSPSNETYNFPYDEPIDNQPNLFEAHSFAKSYPPTTRSSMTAASSLQSEYPGAFIGTIPESLTEDKNHGKVMLPTRSRAIHESKRREQNRRAQRNYRERRDNRLKEVEKENDDLNQRASQLLAENQQLRQHLQKAVSQCRAHHNYDNLQQLVIDSGMNARTAAPVVANTPTTPGILKAASPKMRQSSVKLRQHHPLDNIQTGPLDAVATWNTIQDHWLCKKGYVRIEDVYMKLGVETCDLKSQVKHEKASILRVIEGCATGKYHELI